MIINPVNAKMNLKLIFNVEWIGKKKRIVINVCLFDLIFRNLMKKHEWEDLGYFNGQQEKTSDSN